MALLGQTFSHGPVHVHPEIEGMKAIINFLETMNNRPRDLGNVPEESLMWMLLETPSRSMD